MSVIVKILYVVYFFQYLENLGYCPQMDSLNFVLTGRQILALIARLRGVDNSEVVNKFLKLFGKCVKLTECRMCVLK